MNYAEQQRKIAEIIAANPIPEDRVDPADSEAQEQARVREWVTKSMHDPQPGASDGNALVSRDSLAATFYAEREHTMKDVVEPMVREINDLKRELVDCRAREKLSEDRCLALEGRARLADERIARIEERQLGPLTSGLPAHSGKTH